MLLVHLLLQIHCSTNTLRKILMAPARAAVTHVTIYDTVRRLALEISRSKSACELLVTFVKCMSVPVFSHYTISINGVERLPLSLLNVCISSSVHWKIYCCNNMKLVLYRRYYVLVYSYFYKQQQNQEIRKFYLIRILWSIRSIFLYIVILLA